MKKTDSGNTCRSGFEADGSVFERDATKGIDRCGDGGERSGVQSFDALAGGNQFTCDGFLEDWSEENDVCIVAGLFYFGEGVAGDGDDGRRERGGGIELADLCGDKLSRSRCEVNSMRASGDGDVGAGVDEEFCWRVTKSFENAAGEASESRSGKVFFAELDVVDPVGCPESGLMDERGELRVPPIALPARRTDSFAGDPGRL